MTNEEVVEAQFAAAERDRRPGESWLDSFHRQDERAMVRLSAEGPPPAHLFAGRVEPRGADPVAFKGSTRASMSGYRDGDLSMQDQEELIAVAREIQKNNPGLSLEKAMLRAVAGDSLAMSGQPKYCAGAVGARETRRYPSK